MLTKITHLTLLVPDQDQALKFYQLIGFTIHTDAAFDGMRWLTLHLPEQPDFELVLLLAETEQEKVLVGKQGASKPFFTLATDSCQQDYERLHLAGVEFVEKPAEQPWGIAAMFKDPFGNLIYICQNPQD